MFNFGPIDLVVVGALAVRRFGVAGSIQVGLLLLPAYMWTLPPARCGCFPQFFRRCTSWEMNHYRAIRWAMKSDLKNLASQQEVYYAEEYSYSTVVSDLAFVSSEGVMVTIDATEDGWTARATHVGYGMETGCAVFYGGIDWVMRTPGGAVPPNPGKVFCDEEPSSGWVMTERVQGSGR